MHSFQKVVISKRNPVDLYVTGPTMLRFAINGVALLMTSAGLILPMFWGTLAFVSCRSVPSRAA